MLIALCLIGGVTIGVVWLAYTAPPCLLCRQRGRCKRAQVCQVSESRVTGPR